MKHKTPFIWETHGIHMGTDGDHVAHGVDEIDAIVQKAIDEKFPGITFIIHSPRTTKYRYAAEARTGISFIRGDVAYMKYANRVREVQNKYGAALDIRYGVELDWMGSDFGLQWNRAKALQVHGADFFIGSVHFSSEGIAYDGSREEAEELVRLRGGEEAYWAGYIEEMIEMVDHFSGLVQVIGHVDLPKLNVPVPAPLQNLSKSPHPLAQRMRVLLSMISRHNLAIDVDLAGHKKGCGVYPAAPILHQARTLNISICLGTDTHAVEDLGHNYETGIAHVRSCGYESYLSYSQKTPEIRLLTPTQKQETRLFYYNLGIEFLHKRNAPDHNRAYSALSAGILQPLHSFFPAEEDRSHDIEVFYSTHAVTLSTRKPVMETKYPLGLRARHTSGAHALSLLFSITESENLTIHTVVMAKASSNTAETYFGLDGSEESLVRARDFLRGTGTEIFAKIECGPHVEAPQLRSAPVYIRDIDGAVLPTPLSENSIFARFENSSGILLTLLGALFHAEAEIQDIQVSYRGNTGFALVGTTPPKHPLSDILNTLGPAYYEAVHIQLKTLVP
ncbi:MAG: histidinol-phosphatase HisJ family protein [Fibrobacterota bacterium]